MSRLAGTPAYPGKSVNGSYYLTAATRKALKRAAKKLKRSESDIIEHGLRVVLGAPGFEPLVRLDKDTPLVGLEGDFGPV